MTELAIRRLQIVEEYSPGNAIDGQMVNHQQHSIGLVLTEVNQRHANERAIGKMQGGVEAIGLLRIGRLCLSVRQMR